MKAIDFDASKAAQLVQEHVISLHGNLAKFTFKIVSVELKNNIWNVVCEFTVRIPDENRTKYLFKVNRNGKTEEIKMQAEEK